MKVAVLSTGGVGDLSEAIRIAHFVALKEGRENVDVHIFCRWEIAQVILHFYGKLYNIFWHLEEPEAAILTMAGANVTLYGKTYDRVFCVWPDTLFHGFDCDKYGSRQAIKQFRLLPHERKIEGNNIFLGLCSTTPGYLYHDNQALLFEMGHTFPDYEIIAPMPPFWASKNVHYGVDKDSNLPKNVHVLEQPDFIGSVCTLFTCKYAVTLDNGMAWLAHDAGIDRLLLDPRMSTDGLAWQARWRTDHSCSIPLQQQPKDICKIVKINLEIPETLTLPRYTCLNNCNWKSRLYLKY